MVPLSVISELKRRKVIRVGIGYLFIAWLVAQILQLVFESFGTPEWAIKTVLVMLAAGFPFALFFAWVYELTPEGIKREQVLPRSHPITLETIKKLKNNAGTVDRLYSIVYKSRCNGVADLNLINSILTSSAQHNPGDGITGVLVATESHFLQVLEGEYESVNTTYERIAQDARHDTLQLISFTQINERKFSDWAMHGIGLFDLNQELTSRLRDQFGSDNSTVRIPTIESEVKDFLDILLLEDQQKQTPE